MKLSSTNWLLIQCDAIEKESVCLFGFFRMFEECFKLKSPLNKNKIQESEKHIELTRSFNVT